MSSVASNAICEQRKEWRREHPFGFMARPMKNPDGTLNLFAWECGIPGMKDTIWGKGYYKLKMTFGNDYPITPPQCQFDPPIFHPNVFSSGAICMPLLVEELDWRPDVTIQQILLAIQKLLCEPNIIGSADAEAAIMYNGNRLMYETRVLFQAEAMRRPKE
ncbi:SUMO-conjugating enzyme UBC9-A-like [Drosophila obscura]|uniref:SUMO-conjugating enzyme UBC9-A-like n=1 Tax=Drosophila obscura TaxID=7282 RepID=UPI001BB1CC9E|nr:SUMO-conjugating enzyme UBC9-A-like [Drosophila obscura]XP_041451474.1 SUMO-conjugating enzyme UBC9-A-like [Drosophila obscura]